MSATTSRADGRCFSRLRLFQDEANNIGSQLIAPPSLHQEQRVHRSAKKQLRIKGSMISLKGLSMTHVSRVWKHASFSEEMAVVVCPGRRSSDGSLLTSSRRLIVFLHDIQI